MRAARKRQLHVLAQWQIRNYYIVHDLCMCTVQVDTIIAVFLTVIGIQSADPVVAVKLKAYACL